MCLDSSVQLWDTAKGTKLRQWLLPERIPLRGNLPRPAGLDAAALSPDGKLLAYVRQNGAPALCELATGKLVHSGETPTRGVSIFAFSPDSRTLAWSGLRDPAIHLMEVATGKERHQFVGHQGGISALTFSANGQRLISGSADTTALVWDLTCRRGAGGAAAEALPLGALDTCWADLAGEDAARAYEAMHKLASVPAQAVPYLNKRLQPVPAVDERRLVRLIADLDNDSFTVREDATKQLEVLGEAATGCLQKALAGKPSAEGSRRLKALLEKQSQAWQDPSPTLRRMLRALETLELAGTLEAQQVLARLAGGAADSRITQEAKESVDRLTRSPRTLPGKRSNE